MMSTFWLGREAMLLTEHIGQVIQVDLYAHDRYQPKEGTKLRLTSYAGTLAGFTENWDTFTYGPDEVGYQGDGREEYPAMSVHGVTGVTVFLTDGRRIEVGEKDYAQVYLPEIEKESNA